MKKLIKTAALLLVIAGPAQARKMETDPTEEGEVTGPPTMDEVIEGLQNDPEVQANFRFCAGTRCFNFEKKNPSPAPAKPDTADTVGRIAGSLLKHTGGYVKVTFTYKKETKNADCSVSKEDIFVEIGAGTGELPSG